MPDTLHERLVRFRYPSIFPLGWLVNALATTAGDTSTKETLSEVRSVSNKTSLTLFDAHTHKLPFDMMSAAMLLLRNTDIEHVTIPVAAYLYYQEKLHKNFFKPLDEVAGMHVYPVFRMEELGKTSRTVHDHSGLSDSEKKEKNLEYMEAIKTMQGVPNTLGVIAPYGSRRTFGDTTKIRSGVVEVAKSEQPVVHSKAKWRKFPIPAVQVSLSPIQTFSSSMPPEQVKQSISESFEKL
jgi:hypothetical protein